jgi:hypothetical protein
MVVHVDGETDDPLKPGPGYSEFKCVNRFAMKKYKKEGIRDEYILQLNHGMAVKDYQWGSFGILCLDPWEFKWFDCDRDQELIDRLIQDEFALWQRIKLGVAPEPLEDIKDRRCSTCQWRRSCRGKDLSEMSDTTGQEGDIVSRPDLLPLIEEIVELGEIADDALELKDSARNLLKAEFTDSILAITAPGYKALNSKSWPQRVDSNALKPLEAAAKQVLEEGMDFVDYEALETSYKRLRDIVTGLTKVRKETPKDKPERTLRIYATGD